MPRSDQADDSARYLLVSIAVDGSVEVAGSPVTDDALVEILEAAHQNDPDTKVVLGAADRVPYGRVVAVIDQVKRAGLTQIALARRE
jgi:biopolymer transport protein ExbD/biopolymer transport protein TolR